jgi:YtcA family
VNSKLSVYCHIALTSEGALRQWAFARIPLLAGVLKQRNWPPFAMTAVFFRRCVSVVAAPLFLTGCSSAPSRSILGSYFPSWMICVLLALLATILVHGLLVKVGIDKELPIPIVVYLAFAIAFSFSIWLLWLA